MEKIFDEIDNNSKVGRRLAREELFKIIFEIEAISASRENLKDIFEKYKTRDQELRPFLKEEELEFIKKYIEGIYNEYDFINEILSENMENWSLDRIGVVERALLKISVYELLKENVPTEVSVNEAVELAKEYGDTKAYEFVNGVLAKVIKAKKIKELFT